MKRKKYSQEYEQHAVELTKLPEATITGVAYDLGINPHMLEKSRKAMLTHGSEEAFPGEGHARDDEVTRLKRELTRVKKERFFLKEAAADNWAWRYTKRPRACAFETNRELRQPVIEKLNYVGRQNRLPVGLDAITPAASR